MPLPAIAVAAYYASLNALPAVAPAIGVAAISFGVASMQQPGQPETVQLAGNPELAAACVQRNVASMNSKLVAMVQPLQGMATMGVVIKQGITGNPVMTIVIQEALKGSQAESRPIADSFSDLTGKVMAGC